MPSTVTQSRRPTAKQILRWLLTCGVLAFVANEGWKLWRSGAQDIAIVSPEWLLPGAMCYLVGWLPSVWFLRRLLREMHHKVASWPVARAYFCGHLGKYVPGKAMALVIRAGMLRDNGVPVSQSVAVAVLETLFSMGTGAALALATISLVVPQADMLKLPRLLQKAVRSHWILPVAVTAITVAGVLVSGWVVSQVVTRIAIKKSSRVKAELRETDTAEPLPLKFSTLSLLLSLPAFVAGWFFHGLSLVCVLATLGQPFEPATTWLACTTAVAAGTSAGFFLLLIPGGIGVREGLIVVVLSPLAGSKPAIAAAVLLRVLWFATELATAGLLYVIRPGVHREEPKRSDPG
jgi:glycosyltransferase 2 family protein